MAEVEQSFERQQLQPKAPSSQQLLEQREGWQGQRLLALQGSDPAHSV
jgi:hypothetical protein